MQHMTVRMFQQKSSQSNGEKIGMMKTLTMSSQVNLKKNFKYDQKNIISFVF